MTPCISKDKKHNFAYPGEPCLNGCGQSQEVKRFERRSLTLEEDIHQRFRIPYPRIFKIKSQIGEQALREIFSAAIHDKFDSPVGWFINECTRNYKEIKWVEV